MIPCGIICELALHWLQGSSSHVQGSHCLGTVNYNILTEVCGHRCQVCILRSILTQSCHILLPRIWTTWLTLQRGCTSPHRYVPLCLHKSICSNVLSAWRGGGRDNWVGARECCVPRILDHLCIPSSSRLVSYSSDCCGLSSWTVAMAPLSSE